MSRISISVLALIPLLPQSPSGQCDSPDGSYKEVCDIAREMVKKLVLFEQEVNTVSLEYIL